MNAKIIPMFILLAAVALSGAAPGVYAEEINEAVVVHEAPVREDSRPVIAPSPEELDGEPLIIAPGPLETIVVTEVSDPNAGIPVIVMEEARPDKPIEHDASDGEKVIAPALDTDSPVIVAEERPLIGGDRDEHGCLGTAGYTWGQDKQACIRPWSGEVQSETVAVPHGDLIGLEEPTNGQPEVSEASFTGPVEWLFDTIASFFQGLFDWLV